MRTQKRRRQQPVMNAAQSSRREVVLSFIGKNGGQDRDEMGLRPQTA